MQGESGYTELNRRIENFCVALADLADLTLSDADRDVVVDKIADLLIEAHAKKISKTSLLRICQQARMAIDGISGKLK
jgi:hypothetical protein